MFSCISLVIILYRILARVGQFSQKECLSAGSNRIGMDGVGSCHIVNFFLQPITFVLNQTLQIVNILREYNQSCGY